MENPAYRRGFSFRLWKRVTQAILAIPRIGDSEKSIFDYENFREFIAKIDKGLAFVGGSIPNPCVIVSL
jgi:hypothetical protein